RRDREPRATALPRERPVDPRARRDDGPLGDRDPVGLRGLPRSLGRGGGQRTKYVFITGGVVSSRGKGLTAAAIGWILERSGLTLSMQKLDPYINVDPGTMSPFQHGEVYVTDHGTEVDLELVHYERFTHARIDQHSNYTTGKIYRSVI